MKRKIRFGVQTLNTASFDELVETWGMIDQLGFSSAWLYDHFVPFFTPHSGRCLEAWTLLSALACHTKRLQLGVLVSANTFRHPALLAKMAATVDHVSGGRVILGIGAGWLESEHLAYGLPFPGIHERIDRLEESVRLIRSLWTQRRTTFAGQYYELRNAPCEPKPVQKPMPPILVGGAGEKLLRVAALNADIWNARGTVEEFKGKIDSLERHCALAGRSIEEIEISWIGFGSITDSHNETTGTVRKLCQLFRATPEYVRESSLVGSTDEIASRVSQLIGLGVSHFILMMAPPFTSNNLVRFSNLFSTAFRT